MNANAVAFVPSPSSSPTDDGVAYLMKQMQSTYGFTDLEANVSEAELSELEAVDQWISEMVELDELESEQEEAMLA
eukprot:CAMPEP_0206135002 /NCGR_PEP_ID=MMETSP1473-20131121/373_1 /ASSEMBLY_ACC=CAM_ASM_001109 /TAXON_ID=1461547 /ORGANISM="Stichococcus sp, Strain RCC1054" /LENGTH=75 /DNA_ID=CAMNT_0053526691 /DNA_START=138 /DNA_END=365 /DNA_ORIENTATION=+